MARKVGDVGTSADGTKFVWKKSKGSNALSRDFNSAAVKRASGGAKPKAVVRKTSTNKPKGNNTNTNTSSSNSGGLKSSVRPVRRPTRNNTAAPTSSVRPVRRPARTTGPKVNASGVGNYSSANSAGPTSSLRPVRRPTNTSTSSTTPSAKSGQADNLIWK